jgi:adenine modification enzyme
MSGYIFSNQMALFGEPFCIGFGDFDFRVEEIHRDMANAIIQRNHYSKKFYNASYIHLGIYIKEELRGVLQFGYAMNPASQEGVVSGTKINEYLELNRMWIDDFAARNSESRAMSHAIKFIRKKHPKIKWIQSFADERCNLFGVVYQACNFVFCGEHQGRFWELDGEFFHDSILTDGKKSLTPKGSKLRANKDRAICHDLRQFRYLYFMAPRFAKGLKLKVFPYPKPDYAARLSDAPLPSGESVEHTHGAAPTSKTDCRIQRPTQAKQEALL